MQHYSSIIELSSTVTTIGQQKKTGLVETKNKLKQK